MLATSHFAPPQQNDQIGLDSSRLKSNRLVVRHYSEFYTYFRVNSISLDMNYKNNRVQYDDMRFFFNKLLADPSNVIDSIVVYGAASPEGNAAHNQVLANSRLNTLRNYMLQTFPSISSTKIIGYSKGENWDGLVDLVSKDASVPYKDEVLGILMMSSNRENREFFLRQLHGGAPWNYISDNLLPLLRGGSSSVKVYSNYSYENDPDIIPKSETIIVPVTPSAPINISAPAVELNTPMRVDTIILKSDTIRIIERIHDTIRISNIVEKPVPTAAAATNNRPFWSLKTNILYWAALQPNVEAEFYFGKHWSLNFEYQVAWWKNAAKHQYYQYTQFGPEGRYWFKGDGNFTGHYIGLHVGFGIYDLSWGGAPDYQGYQGEFAIALGFSYGHTWKVGKQLYLEAGLGFGYIMTEYRRYRYIDECYVYQATERMQFLGPTKARLTLQWRFGYINGSKKNKGF